MEYTMLNRFIYRTPLMPLSSLSILENYAWEDIFLFIKTTFDTNQTFVAALQMSSPDLYERVVKVFNEADDSTQNERDKIAISFLKYYLRACSRPTPFGLFASCGIGQVKDGEKSIICKDNTAISSRLDMGLACFLAKQLLKNDFIRVSIKYKINTSIYCVNKEYRYMKAFYNSYPPEYKLTSCQKNPLLDEVFRDCEPWRDYSSILISLVDLGISEEQSKAFLDELIEDQFLVSELTPNITGQHFFESIIEILSNVINKNESNIAVYASSYASAKEHLAKFCNWIDLLKDNGDAQHISVINDLIKRDLAALEITYNSPDLIQTDLFRKDETVFLSNKIERQIFEAISIMNSVQDDQKVRQEEFKVQYEKKYERRTMPLTQVMDNDFGIGFANQLANFKEASYIVEGLDSIVRNNEKNDINRGLKSKIKNQIESVISNNELEAIIDNYVEKTKEIEEDYGDHFSIVLNVHKTESKSYISFSSIYPGSGPNLLGRFTYLSPLIEELVMEQRTSIEEGMPTEVLHMPGERVGNVLHRKIMTKFEIEYLSKSLLPPEHVIAARDIDIKVKGNYFELFHKKTGQVILPTTSNAHAYNENDLPVFNFLRSLSIIGKDYMSFDIDFKPFSPRVTYKNVILSPAKWLLTTKDLQISEKDGFSEMFSAFKKWKEAAKLPAYVFVEGDSDNEILINTNHEVIVRVLFDELRKRKSLVLKEFIGDLNTTQIQDSENQPYASQYILLFKKNQRNKERVIKTNPKERKKIERYMPLSGNWLYFKIYAGPSIQDKILTEYLNKLLKQYKVSKVFFTRYFDTDMHLRVRLFFNSVAAKNDFWDRFEKKIAPLVNQSLIYSVQIENYKREVERYTAKRMEHVEAAFTLDSMAVLAFLSIEDESGNARWKFGLKYIQMVMDIYFKSAKGKFKFCEHMVQLFLNEQPNSKFSKVVLSNKFKNIKHDLNDLLNSDDTVYDELLGRYKTQYKALFYNMFNDLDENNTEVLASVIHMNINRLFQTRQRLYEMTLYYFLLKYYDHALNTTLKNAAE